MYILGLIVLLLVIVIIIFLLHPQLGASAKGEQLEKIRSSPNHNGKSFVNHSHTPTLTEGFSMSKVMVDFLFRKGPGTKPSKLIPSVKTDIKSLPLGDWLVWFGHSSYFLTMEDLNILVDPVFSGNASPIPGSTRAFKGSDDYEAEDMPVIDLLLITHDHYDHLDYRTVKMLVAKVKNVICGLGVGAHLERWGYDRSIITELDWNTETVVKPGIKIYGLPARHFSGRSYKRDQTLWMSYLLETQNQKIYIGGDSGYDAHFKAIGDLHGPIDLAILENGQYNEAWKAIHFLPGENLQAALDLRAKRLMPVHSSKFSLALHDWDEPLKEMVRLNEHIGIDLVTPRIGEPVDLKDHDRSFIPWWTEL